MGCLCSLVEELKAGNPDFPEVSSGIYVQEVAANSPSQRWVPLGKQGGCVGGGRTPVEGAQGLCWTCLTGLEPPGKSWCRSGRRDSGLAWQPGAGWGGDLSHRALATPFRGLNVPCPRG